MSFHCHLSFRWGTSREFLQNPNFHNSTPHGDQLSLSLYICTVYVYYVYIYIYKYKSLIEPLVPFMSLPSFLSARWRPASWWMCVRNGPKFGSIPLCSVGAQPSGSAGRWSNGWASRSLGRWSLGGIPTPPVRRRR